MGKGYQNVSRTSTNSLGQMIIVYVSMAPMKLIVEKEMSRSVMETLPQTQNTKQSKTPNVYFD